MSRSSFLKLDDKIRFVETFVFFDKYFLLVYQLQHFVHTAHAWAVISHVKLCLNNYIVVQTLQVSASVDTHFVDILVLDGTDNCVCNVVAGNFTQTWIVQPKVRPEVHCSISTAF